MNLEKVIISTGSRPTPRSRSIAVWAISSIFLRLLTGSRGVLLQHLLFVHVFNCVIEVRYGLLVLLSDLFDLSEIGLALSQLLAQSDVVTDGVADFLFVEWHLEAEMLEQLSGIVLELASLEQVLLVVIDLGLVLLKEVFFVVHVVNHDLLLLLHGQISCIVLVLEILNDLSHDEYLGAIVIKLLLKLGVTFLEKLYLLLELLFKDGSSAGLFLIVFVAASRNQS